MLESCVTLEPGIFEFEEHSLFDHEGPTFILGLQYSSKQDFEEIKNDLNSRLWFTYRKPFQPIGGTGPTTDQGWGCMLRCGQMLLAQALLCRHLGRDWRWNSRAKEPQYLSILRQFEDKKDRLYSLHQIAQMGVSEGKPVGEWFGPNTAAQVLKKLAVYDDWSSLAVHVAMDNAVVVEDIRTLCRTPPPPHPSGSGAGGGEPAGPSRAPPPSSAWRPLVLVVPLRLGLDDLNPCYSVAMKCLGIMGGRPNHALYFVGCVRDQVLYLDPHECQSWVDLDGADAEVDDTSFHCPFILHMPLLSMDPSLALGFLCLSESDFDDLCSRIREGLLLASHPPLFELLEKRPAYWPKFVPYVGEETSRLPTFTVVEPHYDTDEEFEILG